MFLEKFKKIINCNSFMSKRQMNLKTWNSLQSLKLQSCHQPLGMHFWASVSELVCEFPWGRDQLPMVSASLADTSCATAKHNQPIRQEAGPAIILMDANRSIK